MEVKFVDLSKQWNEIKIECLPKIHDFLYRGNYQDTVINEEFESSFSKYIGTKYAAGVSNGQEGIKIALKAMASEGLLTAVVVPNNTYVASALPVRQLGFDLVLLDCNAYYQLDLGHLEVWLNKNYRKYDEIIVMPVHLTGHPVDMKKLCEMQRYYKFMILEDCSQAHGAKTDGRKVGNFGDVAVFSCQPTKPLGAAGEAGIITTNNKTIYKVIKHLRNRGLLDRDNLIMSGWNNRISSIQAIILNEKLKYLDEWNENKIKLAAQYNIELLPIEEVWAPLTARWVENHAWHTYVVRVKDRDLFQKSLLEKGIQTAIHYPTPIDKQSIYSFMPNNNTRNSMLWANEVVSLPMYPHLKESEVSYICDTIKEHYA